LLNKNTTVLNLIKNDIRQEQSKIDYDNSDNVKISLFSEQTEFLKYLAVESKFSLYLHIYCIYAIYIHIITTAFLLFCTALEHRKCGNNNTATEMDIWNGNLQENLMTAVKEYRLNDFLVSLAPSLSMKYIQIFLLQAIGNKKIQEILINRVMY